MKKTIASATAAVVVFFSLVACSSEGNNPQEIGSCLVEGSAAVGCEVIIDYKGKPLNCVSWDGSHSETGLTCDFVQYHKENKK